MTLSKKRKVSIFLDDNKAWRGDRAFTWKRTHENVLKLISHTINPKQRILLLLWIKWTLNFFLHKMWVQLLIGTVTFNSLFSPLCSSRSFLRQEFSLSSCSVWYYSRGWRREGEGKGLLCRSSLLCLGPAMWSRGWPLCLRSSLGFLSFSWSVASLQSHAVKALCTCKLQYANISRD